MRCKDVRLSYGERDKPPEKEVPAYTWKTKFWPTWCVSKARVYARSYRGIHVPSGLAWARDFANKTETKWRTELMFTLMGKDRRQNWLGLDWDFGARKCRKECEKLTGERWSRNCVDIAKAMTKERAVPCVLPDWALDLNADEMILLVDYLIEIGRTELAMDIRRHWILEFGPV